MGLAFGSDAPVTPVDPWGGVRAAVHHHNPDWALSLDAALQAHTRGGYQAAGVTEPLAGTLEPGAPASYAIWDGDLTGSPAAAPPVCLRTVHRGRILFERKASWYEVG
jgi:predicted amidohydrolase YtcJ